jgi:hypothetical protein
MTSTGSERWRSLAGRPNIHTGFEVEDFGAALTAMREAGYEIIKGPIERADGLRAGLERG